MKQVYDLTEKLKEDLLLLQKEIQNPNNLYMLSYCMYVGFVDKEGEVVHITGVQTLEPESLLGRLEITKHDILNHRRDSIKYTQEDLNQDLTEDKVNILKAFKANKDKPN